MRLDSVHPAVESDSEIWREAWLMGQISLQDLREMYGDVRNLQYVLRTWGQKRPNGHNGQAVLKDILLFTKVHELDGYIRMPISSNGFNTECSLITTWKWKRLCTRGS